MQIKSPNMLFIMLWKVTGALEKPKYITVASKRSSCNKHYLLFILFFDVNIVVLSPQVNFGKD